MELSDEELRGLVREAVARVRAGRQTGVAGTPGGGAAPSGSGSGYADAPFAPAHAGFEPSDGSVAVTLHVQTGHHVSHPSHGLLPLGPGGDADGNCVIEPTVRCTHCGYCQSFGH